jgi:hypothetical protein
MSFYRQNKGVRKKQPHLAPAFFVLNMKDRLKEAVVCALIPVH